MAVLLASLGAFVYARQSADLIGAVDMGLRSRAQALTDAIANGRDADLNRSGVALIDPDEAFAQTLAPAGDILDASPGGRGRAPAARDRVRRRSGAGVRDRHDRRLRRSRPPARGDGRRWRERSPRGLVDPGLHHRRCHARRHHRGDPGLVTLLLVVGSLALVATTLAGWVLAGAALRPVERMRREAAAISASEPGRRLEVPHTRDELARLATTINEMLDRLQETLERERRFVDDASHELRTPLATLRGEIDLALARPRSGDELESSLWSALEDVVRLQRLADDLLVLARSRVAGSPSVGCRRRSSDCSSAACVPSRRLAAKPAWASPSRRRRTPSTWTPSGSSRRFATCWRTPFAIRRLAGPSGSSGRGRTAGCGSWSRTPGRGSARAPRRRVRPVRHRGRAGRGRRPERRRAGTRDRQGRGGGPRRHGLGRRSRGARVAMDLQA